MKNEDPIAEILDTGMKTLNIQCAIEPFLIYLSLLHKWNKAYNLTAIRDLSDMATRHILDSLAISKWMHGSYLIDVGTGAGLPGIPLALANPSLHVVLLDSNGKKVRFLQEVKRVLNLAQVDVIHSRIKDYHPQRTFDTVTSRAFSEIALMLNHTQHLIAEDGIWLAMKGRYPAHELSDMPYAHRVESYAVSGIDGERCCVIIENKEKSWQK
jgi:16S rRNA (guanine527-N7)-methyltransferase